MDSITVETNTTYTTTDGMRFSRLIDACVHTLELGYVDEISEILLKDSFEQVTVMKYTILEWLVQHADVVRQMLHDIELMEEDIESQL